MSMLYGVSNFGYSIKPESLGYFVYDTFDYVDSSPKEIAADVVVTHYHGDYFGMMRSDNLAAHCSYHADPETAEWLRLAILLDKKIEYVVYGEKYDKAMFRIKEEHAG